MLQSGAGVKGVLQGVGQQHAQVALRNGQHMGQLGVDGQGHVLVFRPGGKGRQDQVGASFSAIDGQAAGLDLRVDGADILSGLVDLAVLQTGVQILQVVAQVVAIGPGLPLGLRRPSISRTAWFT